MNWYKKLKEVHTRRDQHIAAAEKIAKELGHALGPWNAFLSNRCRRCSMTVFLHNVLTKTAAPNHTGRAVTDKCNVYLENETFGFFEEPLAKNTVL